MAEERNAKDFIEGTKNAFTLCAKDCIAVLEKESKLWNESLLNTAAIDSKADNQFIENFKSNCSAVPDFSFADTDDELARKLGKIGFVDLEDRIIADPDVKEGRKRALERKKQLEKECGEVEKISAALAVIIETAKESSPAANGGVFTEVLIKHSQECQTRLENLSQKKHKIHSYINQIDGKPLPDFQIGNSGPKSPKRGNSVSLPSAPLQTNTVENGLQA